MVTNPEQFSCPRITRMNAMKTPEICRVPNSDRLQEGTGIFASEIRVYSRDSRAVI